MIRDAGRLGLPSKVPGEVLVRANMEGLSRGEVTRAETRGRGSRSLMAVADELGMEARPMPSVRPRPGTQRGETAKSVGITTYRMRYDRRRTDTSTILGRLADCSEVISVEPNRFRMAQFEPSDPLFSDQWALERIGCPAAWDIHLGDPSLIVAVLDSGLSSAHAEITSTRAGRDFVDVTPGSAPSGWQWTGDFAGPDDSTDDDFGHGTQMASLIAAAADGSGMVGVAPGCSILPVRVLARLQRTVDGFTVGFGTSADIAAGIDWAVSQGARVINLSMAFEEASEIEEIAVQNALAADVLVVAASGNNEDLAGPMYPAAYPGVLAVGAMERNFNIPTFSQRGDHLGLVAPGVDIVVKDHLGTVLAESGTSHAAAMVSGVAALVRSLRPDLSAEDVRDVLRRSAVRPWASLPFPNPVTGFGLLNAQRALELAQQV